MNSFVMWSESFFRDGNCGKTGNWKKKNNASFFEVTTNLIITLEGLVKLSKHVPMVTARRT